MTRKSPLSDHARGILAAARARPVLRQDVNPGVAAKLIREGLVGIIRRPSPYPSRKGELVDWITAEPTPTDPTRPPDAQRSAFVPIGSKVGRPSLLIIDDDEGDEAPDPDQARPDRAGGPEGGRGG